MRFCFSLLLTAAVAVAQQRSFVACPIVRDTKTVPCFLAEDSGELYFLGTGDDRHAPQLKHEVLVEGRIAPGPKVCGGIPLQPVSISVMKEVNLACNTLLPPEPGIDAPVSSHASKAVEPLTGAHEFTIPYSFNEDDLEPAASAVLTEAAAYATRIRASSVKVAGYQSATQLSNGTRLVEKEGLAEKRAQSIATLLRGLDVTVAKVEWKTEPEPAGPDRRRVSILIAP